MFSAADRGEDQLSRIDVHDIFRPSHAAGPRCGLSK